MRLVLEKEDNIKVRTKKTTALTKAPYERSSFEISGSEGDLGYAHVIQEGKRYTKKEQ